MKTKKNSHTVSARDSKTKEKFPPSVLSKDQRADADKVKKGRKNEERSNDPS